MNSWTDRFLAVCLVCCLIAVVGANSHFVLGDCADLAPTSGVCTSCDFEYSFIQCPQGVGGPQDVGDCEGNHSYHIHTDSIATTYSKGHLVDAISDFPCGVMLDCELFFSDDLEVGWCGLSGEGHDFAFGTFYEKDDCDDEG